MKLTQKVLLMAIMPLLLGGLTLAIKSYFATRDMALTALNQYAEDMLEIQSTQVALVFDNAVTDLTNIASQPQLQSGERNVIIRYLKETHPIYSDRFMGLYWVELSGEVFGQEGARFSNSDRDFYPDFRRGDVVISKAVVDKDSGTPTVVVIVPVYDNNRNHIGGLATTVGVFKLLHLLVAKKPAFRGFSVLIDSDNNIISTRHNNDDELLRSGFQPLKDRSADVQFLVKEVNRVSNSAPTVVDEAVINGEPYFVYHRQLPPSDWTIATLFPRKALMGPIQRMQYTTIAVILCSVLASLFLMVLLRKIIFSPIKNLVDAYRRLAQNDLTARSSVNTKDELGDLAQSFNKMADSLEQLRRQEVQTEKELRLATEKAEEASAKKSEFIATMSHELRTPLQGIVGAADLIDATNKDEEIAGYVRIIYNSSNTLTRFINNIFDVSKINSGTTDLEYAPFDLREMMNNSLLLMRPKALQKQLEMRSFFGADLAAAYWGDEDRLRQVLINLLGNAVKFTHRGSVDIHVSRLPSKDEDSHKIKIEVRDTGIGIGKEAQAKMFDAYYQASSDNALIGSGLGLAISRKLITAMDGEIAFSSEVDQGSSFWIVLRLKPSS